MMSNNKLNNNSNNTATIIRTNSNNVIPSLNRTKKLLSQQNNMIVVIGCAVLWMTSVHFISVGIANCTSSSSSSSSSSYFFSNGGIISRSSRSTNIMEEDRVAPTDDHFESSAKMRRKYWIRDNVPLLFGLHHRDVTRKIMRNNGEMPHPLNRNNNKTGMQHHKEEEETKEKKKRQQQQEQEQEQQQQQQQQQQEAKSKKNEKRKTTDDKKSIRTILKKFHNAWTRKDVTITPSERKLLEELSERIKNNMPDLKHRALQVSWGSGSGSGGPKWWSPTKGHTKKKREKTITKSTTTSSSSSRSSDSSSQSEIDGGYLLYSYLVIMKWPKDLLVKFPFRLCAKGCKAEVAIGHSLEWREKYQPWCITPSAIEENKNGWVYHRNYARDIISLTENDHDDNDEEHVEQKDHYYNDNDNIDSSPSSLSTVSSSSTSSASASSSAAATATTAAAAATTTTTTTMSTPSSSSSFYGHAMVWCRPGQHRVQNPYAYFRAILNTLDKAIQGSLLQSDEQVGKFNIVIDATGYSFSKLPALSYIKQAVIMLQDHFPNRLGMVFMVNLSRPAEFFLQLVLPLLTKEVREKIRILPHHPQQRMETLRGIMGTERTIPYWLGGSDPYKFHVDTYYPPETRCANDQITEQFLQSMPYHAT